jgi:lysozyme family protein
MENNFSQKFAKAVVRVLEFEGGYVNDPNDNGGETKYGISKNRIQNLI